MKEHLIPEPTKIHKKHAHETQKTKKTIKIRKGPVTTFTGPLCP